MKEYDIPSLLFLYECYSHNAQEVVKRLNDFVKDFSDEEKRKFFFDVRTQYNPLIIPKYKGGDLNDEELKVCKRIMKKNGIEKI